MNDQYDRKGGEKLDDLPCPRESSEKKDEGYPSGINAPSSVIPVINFDRTR